MGRHQASLRVRLGAWRRRRRQERADRAERQRALVAEQERAAAALAWPRRRTALEADGLLPAEPLRSARPVRQPAQRSPLPDATPPTTRIPRQETR